MLVLSRRLHEKILFPGFRTAVQVVAIKAGVVRLGVQAPPEVTVLRAEVPDRAAEWRSTEARPGSGGVLSKFRELNHVLRNRFNVAGLGLAVLRRHLRAGRTEDAEATLAKIEEDFRLLRQRLEGEVERLATPPPVEAGKSRKALLVEDNPNERELLATLLRSSGLEVDTAGDGVDALDYLHTQGHPVPSSLLWRAAGLIPAGRTAGINPAARGPRSRGVRDRRLRGPPFSFNKTY